jgi:hypothetical protein
MLSLITECTLKFISIFEGHVFKHTNKKQANTMQKGNIYGTRPNMQYENLQLHNLVMTKQSPNGRRFCSGQFIFKLSNYD